MSLWFTGPLRAQQATPTRVTLEVTPAGARAERVAARTRELLALRGVQVVPVTDAHGANGVAPAIVARIAVDVSQPERATLRIDGHAGVGRRREVELVDGLLDEAACEQIATQVASDVEALRGARAGHEHEARATEAEAVPEPVRAPLRVPNVRAASTTTDTRSPAARERVDASDARHAAQRMELQAHAGYELAYWGEGQLLHGPRLTFGATWALAMIRLGAGIEGYAALPVRVKSAEVEAELWATAMRVLFLADLPLGGRWEVATAAGIRGEYTHLAAVSARAPTTALRTSEHWGWGGRLYAAGRVRLGARCRGVLALGLALEIDPVRVDYGVRYSDGFVVTHRPWVVRPSLVASVGMAF